VKGVQQHPEGVVVTVGGDHSVGTATLHALNSYYKDLKVIWVDAHPDFIHPLQSHYQNYHGYPVAHVTGLASSIPGFKWLTDRIPY
jgi:arginase